VSARDDTGIDPLLVGSRAAAFDDPDRGAVRRTTDAKLVEIERAVRRALVARNGVDLGCEAAAEAMAWAIEHRDRFDLIDQPIGYLYRVGQSSLRRQRRWARPAPVRFEAADDDPMLFDRELFDALVRLSHDQRVAVVMVHCYGYRYRDVAEVLGVSDAAVTNHVHRGLARLRTLLGDPS
jgi:RNA polymerase sigma factor (sigma-70 family)